MGGKNVKNDKKSRKVGSQLGTKRRKFMFFIRESEFLIFDEKTIGTGKLFVGFKMENS